MNGEIVPREDQGRLLQRRRARSPALAPDDGKAVETAYLTVLTRRPTPEESVALCWAAGRDHRRRPERAADRPLLDLAQHDGILLEPLRHVAMSYGHLRPTFDRRGFLKLAGLSWLTPVGQLLADQAERTRQPAQSIILLWLGGGPSQLETFDPHPGYHRSPAARRPSRPRSRASSSPRASSSSPTRWARSP